MILTRFLHHFLFNFILTVFIFAGLSFDLYADGNNNSKHFSAHILKSPKEQKNEIVSKFNYIETGKVLVKRDSLRIFLENGYACHIIKNPEELLKMKERRYEVARVEVVYTQYPFNKSDWLTNYYDLLSWRLEELFKLDSTINSSAIQWDLVSQTDCHTSKQAKDFFHGIVVHFQPVKATSNNEIPPALNDTMPDKIQYIPNNGYIFRGERDPDYFKSNLEFPSKGGKRNMDQKDLKCPTWQ